MGGKGGGMGGGYTPSRQQFGPPNMGGKGGGMGGGYGPRPMPNMGGKGGGYGPQGGFGGFGPQQPPQFSPDTMNQMKAFQQQLASKQASQGTPVGYGPNDEPIYANTPQSPGPGAPPPQQAFQDFRAQQQMPSMGGKGGPQQLPQGMGGYMQQMALSRYAQPQFQPQMNPQANFQRMPNMGGLASLGLGGYGSLPPGAIID
jgi:hypothetical protein